MDYDAFVYKVQKLAGLDSRDKAMQVIEVTLNTLSERISAPCRKHLFTQLPKEFGEFTVRQKSREFFSLEEFYQRISARSETTYHEAMKNARALMCVLQEAVAQGDLDNIFSELHDGWEELLDGKGADTISPHTVDTHELFRK